MRTDMKPRTKATWAALALGILVSGCGESQEQVAYGPPLPRRTNVPTLKPAAKQAGEPAHLHPVDADSARDQFVRPADFTWQSAGPALPMSPGAGVDANEALRRQSEQLAAEAGRPPESLYGPPTRQRPADQPVATVPRANAPKHNAPDNADNNADGSSATANKSTRPWAPQGELWNAAAQRNQPPPAEAYLPPKNDYDTPALVDGGPGKPRPWGPGDTASTTNTNDDQTAATALSPDGLYPEAAPAPVQPPTFPETDSQDRLPWQATTWEPGPRAAYAPAGANAPELPAAVTRRAEELTQNAFQLAGRGALYSAREELIQALEIIAESLDAAERTDSHRRALAEAFRAMEEASDFSPRGGTLLGQLDIKTTAGGHLTPVLRDPYLDLTRISGVECSRAYYTYAQNRLTFACGTVRPASLALYGLGKIDSNLGESGNDRLGDSATRSIVCQQAALAVDSGNWRAANELAVQLARGSRFEEARGWLQHATQLSNAPELWTNLASVHGYLGEERLARQASEQSARLAQRTDTVETASGVSVQWVPPQAFQGTPPDGQ